MKTLVVFYSRTENTARLAQKISTLLAADSDRIVSKASYDGWLGYWRGAFHSLDDTRGELDLARIGSRSLQGERGGRQDRAKRT